MDMDEESDSTLSDVSDETIYLVVDDSDEECLPTLDIPQLTIGSPINGLNKCPVFYTNPPPPASVSMDPNFQPLLSILISMFAEILRSRAPTSDEPQNSPPYVLPLTSYPDYEPPPFRQPTLSIPSSNTTNNNPSETSAPSQQATNTLIQTTSESSNSATQKGKRGCKRSRDDTNDINYANIISDNSIPKKREKKFGESSNDCMDGKVNNTSPHETSENTEEKMEEDLSD